MEINPRSYNANSAVKSSILSGYTQGTLAIVAQGGGQKGIFTAGVFDAFLTAAFDPFSLYIGTSAGALNLSTYLSRQPGLGKAFVSKVTTQDQFFNLFRYIRRSQSMDLDWALSTVTTPPFQLDLQNARGVLRHRTALASVTCGSTLQDAYLPMFQDNWSDVLKATCAIPMLYPKAVSIDDNHWLDGGVSAAIPVQEAWRRGSRVIVVVRTEPTSNEELEPQVSSQFLDKLPEYLSKINQSDKLESIKAFHSDLTSQFEQLKSSMHQFAQEKFVQLLSQHVDKKGEHIINGGRWLFGGDDIYRLAALTGGRFDSRLVDMLLVHYQTYELTERFLTIPPDDCCIIQIAPQKPLQSLPLLSKQEALEMDYQAGVEAGYQFIRQYSHYFQ